MSGGRDKLRRLRASIFGVCATGIAAFFGCGLFLMSAATSAAESGLPAAGVPVPTSAVTSLAGARASDASGECRGAGGGCSQVVVPLDWSKQTPGSVSLHVVVHRATGRARGVMFLLAGGPGQASAQLFD